MTRHNQAAPSPYRINTNSERQLDGQLDPSACFGLSLNMEPILTNSDSGSRSLLDTA